MILNNIVEFIDFSIEVQACTCITDDINYRGLPRGSSLIVTKSDLSGYEWGVY